MKAEGIVGKSRLATGGMTYHGALMRPLIGMRIVAKAIERNGAK